MRASDIAQAADDLHVAERSGRQIGLLSLAHPGMTLENAYSVQRLLVDKMRRDGRRAVGWKIGLTSKAMQRALDIRTPDSGLLFADMRFADGATVPERRFIEPRIEAEIAFIMKDSLGLAAMSRQAVLDAVEYAAPALEILDTRIMRRDPATGIRRGVVDTIADNAANAGFVLGSVRHRPGAFDLRRIGVILERNQEVEETGMGAGVLNDPITALIWLSDILHANGTETRPGDVILSGSFIRPVEAVPGSRFFADFGEFGTAAVNFA